MKKHFAFESMLLFKEDINELLFEPQETLGMLSREKWQVNNVNMMKSKNVRCHIKFFKKCIFFEFEHNFGHM